ncbi:ABC transporter substrate-binding protein [Shimia biformata]|uniref:ABC transporter substrate-binding protein n=1 Tax=Shimia biformata TaxID=1294299 RepID=UPI0019514A49|nr:ABC transporter substrate-binding protein [Shimia biformata]
MPRHFALILATALFASPVLAEYKEGAFWKTDVDAGSLPPITERLPEVPLVVDLEAKGRVLGKEGGTLSTMVTRTKDVRQMVVYGYARLVGYDHSYRLVPDILQDIEVEDGRKFTLRLRPGHKWSDGHPFTSEDFRYWWENVANNPELSPSGPSEFLRVDGQLPEVTFPDARTIIYEWQGQNPQFMQAMAEATPVFIYRPAHYLKPFHADFNDPDTLRQRLREKRVRSWAALHNKLDNMSRFDNPDLPTLQPWMVISGEAQTRAQFVRNPYYHRVDTNGVQLPYIDVVEMDVVAPGLMAAKANAGETELQARGLDFKDAAILRRGEAEGGYRMHLWDNGVASQIAIYLNLNYNDEGWRNTMRDVRFRRALSLAIDRKTINKALYFGLAKEGAMTVLPLSPFFKEKNRKAWSAYDPVAAGALLDEMGLTKRDREGTRMLPDGRPLWIVIETAGERQEVENALQIITDNWRDIGVKLIMRPLERDILRNRVYAGNAMAAVWFGWDHGLVQPHTPPVFAVPMQQEFFAWPKWGQYYQTHGTAGEPPDMPAAVRLMELGEAWKKAPTSTDRSRIWQEIVDIHADQVYAIGILAEAPQPVVVSHRLKNVPEKAIWAWSPGAHFGVHRMDEFFFSEPEGN